MDYVRIIAGIASYLIVLIIGLVMYVVSLKHDRRSVVKDNKKSKRREYTIDVTRADKLQGR